MSTVQDSSSRLFWLIVLSAIFPPFAVALEFGVFRWDTLWNILLTILLPFGGFVHAAYLLTKARYERASQQGYEPVGDGTEATVGEPSQAARPQAAGPASQPARAADPENQNGLANTHGPADPPPYTSNGTSTLDNKIQRQA